MSISPSVARKLARERRNSKEITVVGIDQSFANYAMVLFKNGVAIDRCVFHTGDSGTKKNQAKDERLTESRFFDNPISQLDYMYGKVLDKIVEWNPQHITMEGLSFGSSGKTERQLGALYFGLVVSLHRELKYSYDHIHTITPTQAKAYAREFLKGDDKFERDAKGEIIILKSKKNKLNTMKKHWMSKALQNSGDGWLLEGYTRDGLVKSRTCPTGVEDLPDAYFIGMFASDKLIGGSIE